MVQPGQLGPHNPTEYKHRINKIHLGSSHIWLHVVFVVDALKCVFLRALLAHLEEPGASVRGQGQLLQHDVLGHANFFPKIHFSI